MSYVVNVDVVLLMMLLIIACFHLGMWMTDDMGRGIRIFFVAMGLLTTCIIVIPVVYDSITHGISFEHSVISEILAVLFVIGICLSLVCNRMIRDYSNLRSLRCGRILNILFWIDVFVIPFGGSLLCFLIGLGRNLIYI